MRASWAAAAAVVAVAAAYGLGTSGVPGPFIAGLMEKLMGGGWAV